MARHALVVATAVLLGLPHAAMAQSVLDDTRKGDVGVGYGLAFVNGSALPAGVVVSGAWRVHRRLDLIAESGLHHGHANPSPLPVWAYSPGGVTAGLTTDVFQLMGGVRASWPTGFSRATVFLQVSAGSVGVMVSGPVPTTFGSHFEPQSSWTPGIEPGGGFEIGVTKGFAIRQQTSVLLTSGRSDGLHADVHLAISAVFRLQKSR